MLLLSYRRRRAVAAACGAGARAESRRELADRRLRGGKHLRGAFEKGRFVLMRKIEFQVNTTWGHEIAVFEYGDEILDEEIDDDLWAWICDRVFWRWRDVTNE